MGRSGRLLHKLVTLTCFTCTTFLILRTLLKHERLTWMYANTSLLRYIRDHHLYNLFCNVIQAEFYYALFKSSKRRVGLVHLLYLAGNKLDAAILNP
ncbi:hypothetical protein BDR03DRAFT_974770 [Suillus americanus]|nr:hypothetical protein BDR03DRAFT_974770 [Suillus americanus]